MPSGIDLILSTILSNPIVILADVILATLVPYVMVLFFCVLVVPIETFIFFKLQRSVVGFGRSLGLVALANLVSWIAGIVIVAVLPVPQGFTTRESEPEYFYGIVVGFVVAFVLSWLIEYWMMRISRRHFGFVRLNRTVGLANLGSYMAVFLVFLLWFTPSKYARADSTKRMARTEEVVFSESSLRFYAKYRKLPSDARELSEALLLMGSAPEETKGWIDAKNNAVDPWGSPLSVRVSSNSFSISSAGPDREWGTADDIVTSSDLPK